MLNTKQLTQMLTGKNKAFITRVSKQQEEKYGNVDIFAAWLGYNEIEIAFGDYSITFFFRNGKVYDTLGNGQGHKYHKSLQSCAEELYKNIAGK